MEYNIKVKLDEDYFDTTIEAENWGDVCEYVFGRIEVIDNNEKCDCIKCSNERGETNIPF